MSVYGVRVVSYHPGVMLTDLWRSQQTSVATKEERARGLFRALCAVCVKHPSISGAGLAALAVPRHTCCCDLGKWFCSPLLHSLPPALVSLPVCCDGGGGYYQQSCCCCIVPVRTRPDMYIQSLQDGLWEASMERLHRDCPEILMMDSHPMAHLNLQNRDSEEKNERSKENGRCKEKLESKDLYAAVRTRSDCVPMKICTPAYQCTECLSIAPMCPFFSCLC